MASLKDLIVSGSARIIGTIFGNLVGNVTGNVTGDVTGNVTGDVTGNASSASQVKVTNNSTNNTYYPVYANGDGGQSGTNRDCLVSSNVTVSPERGTINLKNSSNSVKGGRIELGANVNHPECGGIMMDSYNSILRIGGITSADDPPSKEFIEEGNNATPKLIINPFNQTVSGAYTFYSLAETKSLTTNNTSMASVEFVNRSHLYQYRKTYSETSGTISIVLDELNVIHVISPSDNSNITFTIDTSGLTSQNARYHYTFEMCIDQTGSTPGSVTWPSNVKFANNSPPNLSVNGVHWLVFRRYATSDYWWGSYQGMWPHES